MEKQYLENLALYIEDALASQKVYVQIVGGSSSPWNATFHLEALNHTRFIDVKTALPSILENFTFDRNSFGWILSISMVERLTTREFDLELASLLQAGVSAKLAFLATVSVRDVGMYSSMVECTASNIDWELLEFLGIGSEIRRCYTQYLLDYGNGITSDAYTIACANLYEKYQQLFNLDPLPLELPMYT